MAVKQNGQHLALRYLVVVAALVALGVAMRWLVISPNFTGVGAVAMFAGFVLPRRCMALLVPLATMIVSNVLLPAYGDWGTMAAVYFSLALPIVFGGRLKEKLSVSGVAAGALAPAVAFYLITNFMVWVHGDMYDLTLAGLGECYVQAIPFFGNYVLGDLLMAGMLFGGYAMSQAVDQWPGNERLIPVRVRKQ